MEWPLLSNNLSMALLDRGSQSLTPADSVSFAHNRGDHFREILHLHHQVDKIAGIWVREQNVSAKRIFVNQDRMFDHSQDTVYIVSQGRL